MNGAMEDLLREGLDRLTAEVQVPPGVTGKARTHLRHKKIAVRAALAGGAAAVTAAAPPTSAARTAIFLRRRWVRALPVTPGGTWAAKVSRSRPSRSRSSTARFTVVLLPLRSRFLAGSFWATPGGPPAPAMARPVPAAAAAPAPRRT